MAIKSVAKAEALVKVTLTSSKPIKDPVTENKLTEFAPNTVETSPLDPTNVVIVEPLMTPPVNPSKVTKSETLGVVSLKVIVCGDKPVIPGFCNKLRVSATVPARLVIEEALVVPDTLFTAVAIVDKFDAEIDESVNVTVAPAAKPDELIAVKI